MQISISKTSTLVREGAKFTRTGTGQSIGGAETFSRKKIVGAGTFSETKLMGLGLFQKKN